MLILPILTMCKNFKSFRVLLDIESFLFLDHLKIKIISKKSLKQSTILSQSPIFKGALYVMIKTILLTKKLITDKKKF